MQLLFGIVLFIGGLTGLMLARPKSGESRSFVGTSLEVPVVLAILGAIAVGAILMLTGIVELRS